MSYVVGINLGSQVYLLADSAVTEWLNPKSAKPDQPQPEYTTFGERGVSTPEKVVFEGALKIIHLGCAAAAFGGNIAFARSILAAFKSALSLHADSRSAFETAVAANGPYAHLGPMQQVKLLVVFPGSPSPHLLAFNIHGNHQITEVPDTSMVHFGSLEPRFKGINAQMVSHLKIFRNEPHRFLAGCLAFLQSYGIRNTILEQGVGGVFCGLMAGQDTVEWQRDILFCLHDGLDPHLKMISSIIQDDVHIARSSVINSCKYFGDSINDGLSDSWRSRWWDPAFDFSSKGRFDFVILLNTRFNIITVVEMLKQHRSNYLRISPSTPQGPDEAFRLNFAFSPLLTKAMTEPIEDRHHGSYPVKFNWFPYDCA